MVETSMERQYYTPYGKSRFVPRPKLEKKIYGNVVPKTMQRKGDRRKDNMRNIGGTRVFGNTAMAPCVTVQRSPKPKSPRACPSKEGSFEVSPRLGFYSGAKFSEPPEPKDLPMPPMHWRPCAASVNQGNKYYRGISNLQKVLLNQSA